MEKHEELVRLFRGLAASGRIEDHWWGAVLTDERYPNLWDANCAVVETGEQDPLRLDEIERELLPALAKSRAKREHIVLLEPERQGSLLAEIEGRGDKIGWDLWMAYEGADPGKIRPGPNVEEIVEFDEAFWERQRRAFADFGVKAAAASQLENYEKSLAESGRKRWFAIRVGGEMSAFGALQDLGDGIVYMDNVLTFPEVRGRGLARAILDTLIHETAAAERVLLLAEEGRSVSGMYEKIGFRSQGRVASSLRTIE